MTWTGPKAMVLHQDDVGMCHGANVAYAELTQFGTCSSGSVMVPCPWFREAAEMARVVPGADMGVHLTLTAEKEHYRWRPLTGASRASGLVDEEGLMWRDVPSVRRSADPSAVAEELEAQIEAAYTLGIDVTHLDGHMGGVFAPEFCHIYLALAGKYRLPLLLTPSYDSYGSTGNLGEIGDPGPYAEVVAEAQRSGFTLFDQVFESIWEDLDDIDGAYRRLISGAAGDLVFAALHFNAPGDIQAIDPPTGARVRVGEYDLFRRQDFKDWLLGQEREVIGMRPLRDRLRAKDGAAPA
ncbi:MAG: polysaccharide deacetylase family protein [Pseudomonadota bacterium]